MQADDDCVEGVSPANRDDRHFEDCLPTETLKVRMEDAVDPLSDVDALIPGKTSDFLHKLCEPDLDMMPHFGQVFHASNSESSSDSKDFGPAGSSIKGDVEDSPQRSLDAGALMYDVIAAPTSSMCASASRPNPRSHAYQGLMRKYPQLATTVEKHPRIVSAIEKFVEEYSPEAASSFIKIVRSIKDAELTDKTATLEKTFTMRQILTLPAVWMEIDGIWSSVKPFEFSEFLTIAKDIFRVILKAYPRANFRVSKKTKVAEISNNTRLSHGVSRGRSGVEDSVATSSVQPSTTLERSEKKFKPDHRGDITKAWQEFWYWFCIRRLLQTLEHLNAAMAEHNPVDLEDEAARVTYFMVCNGLAEFRDSEQSINMSALERKIEEDVKQGVEQQLRRLRPSQKTTRHVSATRANAVRKHRCQAVTAIGCELEGLDLLVRKLPPRPESVLDHRKFLSHPSNKTHTAPQV